MMLKHVDHIFLTQHDNEHAKSIVSDVQTRFKVGKCKKFERFLECHYQKKS